jgi:hypothetical protein
MALLKRSTPEELQAKETQKAAQAAEKTARQLAESQAKERQKLERAAEKVAQDFARSPVGKARAAYEQGDLVFQFSLDVMSQQAIIVIMVGSSTVKSTTNPTDVLNAVCREGWDLVNGSFVFVEEGQQSRDKFMASGQNVAIKGTTVGYYLFKRGIPASQVDQAA